MPFYLHVTRGYGLTATDINHSTIEELNPYVLADKEKERTIDMQQWRNGMYMISAMTVAIDRCFNGKKSKAEYLKECFSVQSERIAEENRPLTDEEKAELTRQLFGKIKQKISGKTQSEEKG